MHYLSRRGDQYAFRVRLPADIARAAGQGEIRKSLRTADRSVARERAALLNLALVRGWAGLRAAMTDTSGAGDVTQRLASLLKSLVSMLDQSLAHYDVTYPVRPLNRPDGYPARIQNRQASELAIEDRDALRADAQRAGDQLPALMAALQDIEAKTGKTAAAAAVAAAMPADILDKLNAVITAAGGKTIRPPAPLFSVFLVDTYTPEVNLRDDAQRHIDGYARLFTKILGDKPIADYDRADIVRWVRTLEKMPKSYGKSPKDQGKSIDTLVRQGTRAGTLGTTTIEKHITHIRAIFLAANKHYKFSTSDEIREELFSSVTLSRTVPKAQKRKSWPIEKLNLLFNSPLWTGTASRLVDRTKRHLPGKLTHRDAYWWLPLIALYTAMRLEEIAQLHHEDLKVDKGGIYYIRVHDEGDRQVKTEHSIRNVPIHPLLVELGFLQIFDASKKGRVWTELKPHGRPPSWGGLYSTHFTDYRRAISLYEPLMDFHSLRRTAITMLRTRCDIDALTVAAIAGHDDSDSELKKLQMTDSYTDYSIAHLHSAISRLDYEKWGVDLSAVRKAGGKG